jgi:hypothetical protein
MVKGIEVFKRHFATSTHQFVLIGGAACDLLHEEAGLQFRATKDLDIVLCIETLDPSFVQTFWDFVRAGRYAIAEESSGKPRFYRFSRPENGDFPFMLELFSRGEAGLTATDDRRITRIPLEEEVASMSAILLDAEYYRYIHDGTRKIDGIPVVRPEHLIPLKARAYLDLRRRKEQGGKVDRADILKHRNDILRLYRILDPEYIAAQPDAIRHDMESFLLALLSDPPDLPSLGIRGVTLETATADLRNRYCP